LCVDIDMAYYHWMSIKLLLKYNIAYRWHNPSEKPKLGPIKKTAGDADTKDANCVV